MSMRLRELFTYSVWNFLVNAVIYAVVTLPFFLALWGYRKKRAQKRRIQENQRSTSKSIWHEIKYSISTLVIFTLISVGIFVLSIKGYTKIYFHISDYGWTYFFLSFAAMMLMHDAWFFFTHRLLHHPKLFKHIHVVHHRSNDPSPFASFSFHPVEAVIQGLILVIFVFVIPVNAIALVVWQLTEMTLNVIGHLGYEMYPKNFTRNKLSQWLITSTHHNMHHSKFKGNYGLYFTWWDRIFKTEFKDYHETFDEVQKRIAMNKDKVNSHSEDSAPIK